jgi:hypothetical protein
LPLTEGGFRQMGRNLDVRLGSCDGITDPWPTRTASIRCSGQGRAKGGSPIDDRGSMACFTTHSACIHRRSRIDPARAAADAWQRLPIGRPCRSAQRSPATPLGSRMFFGASALPLPSCQLTTVVYCLAARFTRHRSRWIASTSRNGASAANSACRIAFGNSIAVRTPRDVRTSTISY